MMKDKLKEFFKSYDPAIQAIISGVLSVEQEYISMEKPRGVMEEIDGIVNAVAVKKTEREDKKSAK